MKESQYTQDYLETTASGRFYTIQTYLHYQLKGTAKSYAGRYAEALRNSVIRRGAVPVRSLHGGVAYRMPEGTR
ncbi:MAG TPA: hypothetical protein VFA52_04230 [Candidatus Paceibacterota bacterium]|jgi:hypothetical protein|nr:hypothetical protein [Candidatus Paceibacterota bacterium]